MAKRDRYLIDGFAALAETLRRQIDAGVDGWDIEPTVVVDRRRQVADDLTGFEYFHRHYFPHYGRAEPSLLHAYLHKRLPAIVLAPTGQRDAIAAPRGEAKSTVVTLVFVLWCVVLKLKHYPIILSNAFPQAAEFLEFIKAELEANPRLASDFPEACGQGRVWRVGCIVAANDVKIEAFGTQKRIRGRRHGPHRPDLAVIDDAEDDEHILSPEQRDKLERFIARAVLSLGPPDDSMDAVMVGTIDHHDSVLVRFIKNPMWHGRVFKAIVKWPDAMPLWEQFEGILLGAETPDEGLAEAMAFYAARKAEMDAGAVVSWPAVRPLVALMIKRAREGHEAFESQQQNDPTAGDDAPFAKSLHFWVNRLAEWVFYGACDPSLGRLGGKASNKRDPSAIGVGGYQRVKGVLDIVLASIRKRTPDRIISDIIEAQREFCCIVWGFEAVQFQEFVRTELVKRSAAAGVPVPARALIPIVDKDLRIESLQPHMHNGLIRLHASQTTLVDQFRHWPKADHDDGPDMVQMLWMLAVTGGVAAGAQSSDPDARARAGESIHQRAARQAQRMFSKRRT